VQAPEKVLTAIELAQFYGSYYYASPKVKLNVADVPSDVLPLLPYAEFWGIADDLDRENLVLGAPPDVRANLKAVVRKFNNELMKWLAGEESYAETPTDEYVAYSAMVMAADFV